MIALLRKDLRLSLDALRPWALIVIGFALGIALLVRAPESVLPDSVRGLHASDLLAILAGVVGVSAIGVSAWSTSVIAHGDRAHGAMHLAAVLPTSRATRVFSKVFVTLGAGLVPAIAAIVALSMSRDGSWPMQRGATTFLSSEGAFLVASSVGIAFALLVAAMLRGTFSVVAIALLLALAAGVVGALGCRAAFPLIARDALEAASASSSSPTYVGTRPIIDGLPSEVAYARDRALWAAALSGIGIAALVSFAIGAVSLGGMLSRRATLSALGVVLAASLMTGVIATKLSFDHDKGLMNWAPYAALRARNADVAAISAAVNHQYALLHGKAQPPFPTLFDTALVTEGLHRLQKLPPKQRERDPLYPVLLRLQDFSTPRLANLSFQFMLPDDPLRLARLLECIVSFPEGQFQQQVAYLLSREPGSPALPPFPSSRPVGREEYGAWLTQMEDWLRHELQRQINAGHPESARMSAALEAIRTTNTSPPVVP